MFVGETSITLDSVDGSVVAAPPNAPLPHRSVIHIISRSFCFEVVRHVPVESRGEARKIASQIPLAAPFDGPRKIKLSQCDEGGFNALISVVDKERLEACVTERPLMMVPQSWLFDALAAENHIELDCAGVLVGVERTGSTSTSAVLSSKSRARDFWWALGIDETTVTRCTQSDFLLALPRLFTGLGIAQWIEAARRDDLKSAMQLDVRDWYRFGKVAGVFFAAYLLLSSAGLSLGSAIVQSYVSSESSEFKEALTLKGRVNGVVGQEEELRALIGDQYPVWTILPVLEVITKSEALVRSIKYTEGTVEVFVLSKDATAVLDNVISSPFVSAAEFGAPVQQDPRTGIERFSVQWTLAESSPDEETSS